MLLSFCAFLYTATEYHILLDGMVSQHKRQLMLVPFFTVNFLFRSLTLSLCWVYWKVNYLNLPQFIEFSYLRRMLCWSVYCCGW